MKIYTKTGDDGETGLFAGPRVSKSDVRIEAYGAVDELNAVLGWVRAEEPPSDIDKTLGQVQQDLFVIGAELATPVPERLSMALIGESQIAVLEQAIDSLEAKLSPLRQFILPGGSRAAAALHVSRTVCRRAERRVVALKETATISHSLIKYLNRLSDLLFVMARATNSAAGQLETPWQP